MHQAADSARDPRPARARLPAAVWALGVTSFFTDAGSEMIFPLLPLFVSSLGATPAFLGADRRREPTERATSRDLAPRHMHGRAFGSYHGAIGLSAIPASVFTGWVWQTVSPEAALGLGAAIAGSAALALWLWAARR